MPVVNTAANWANVQSQAWETKKMHPEKNVFYFSGKKILFLYFRMTTDTLSSPKLEKQKNLTLKNSPSIL